MSDNLMTEALAHGLEMLDPEACRTFLIRNLFQSGPICTGCGVSFIGRQAETFNAGGRVHCNSCGQWVTYRTGTPLHGSTLDDRQIFLLAHLTSLSCPINSISEACRVTDQTVRAWQARFRMMGQ